MIVCHCYRVCDRTIRGAIREGACSRRQITERCAAGGGCGGCTPVIDEILASEQQSEAPLGAALVPELAAAAG